MKKHGIEWKEHQQDKKGGWAQKHGSIWMWHYIQYNTEYTKREDYTTKKECEGYNYV